MSALWAVRTEPLTEATGLRLRVDRPAGPASFADVVTGWTVAGDFRARFSEVLAAVPYPAFRWELPAVTDEIVGEPFEAVVLPSPEIDRPADPSAFRDQFAACTEMVTVFPNLGGDATLVVPLPSGPAACYAHLAAFVRGAPDAQRFALWETVGRAMVRRIGSKPVWLNTAGAGVPWLHIRLDDRPKYYRYGPFI